MYLWRIELLKNRLREGPLSQRAAFVYILATLLLYVITTAAPGLHPRSEAATTLDWLTYGLTIAIVGGGTYAAYRANGGQAGSDFASRYFALGWVLFLRLAVLFFAPATALVFGAGAAFGAFESESERFDSAFEWAGAAVGLTFEAVYYWRLVHHLRQLAGAGSGLQAWQRG